MTVVKCQLADQDLNTSITENKLKGNGVTIMPVGGTYKLLIGSSGCQWVVSAKRTSVVAGYDHETP